MGVRKELQLTIHLLQCDAAGPPCKPCRDLNVECTFNRAMKRRGPPNKHAEAARAAKQPRLEPSLQSQSPQSNFHTNLHPAIQANVSVGVSPTPHNASGTLVSIAGNDNMMTLNGLGAEAIAPFEVLEHLVQDFFTYIHPLTPFPHEPTFMKSFYDREDRTNPEFLALLSSMIGCLVASFPRAAREHLKSQQTSNLFPRAITLIDRCREVALDARGSRFDNKEEITVYDAATSYFLGLAAGYTLQWKICRRFMGQTITFIREMGYHKPPDLGSSMYGVTYRGPPFDHVQDQLGKRLFWVMLLGVRSMYQLGAPIQDLILPPPTPSEHYPDYPQEVDDQYILPQQILGQPVGEVSLLTGFVQACRIYMTMNPLVSVELSYGLTTLPWPNQRKMLVDCLQKVKDLMKNLPRELTLDMNAAPGQGGPNAFENHPAFQYQPLYSTNHPSNDMRSLFRGGQSERRRLQYEIQQANIYASQLATRSYYVERYFNLRDAHREHIRGQTAAQAAYAAATGSTTNGTPVDDNKAVAAAAIQAAMEQDPVDETMRTEREEIVKNLLTVLTSLPQRNMEPNGGSLINKIRQVASTLLNDNPDHKGPVAMQVQEYLARFLGILTRLEKTGPANGGVGAGVAENHGVMTLQDEEEELRNWADLADHQRRFAAQGGFLMGL